MKGVFHVFATSNCNKKVVDAVKGVKNARVYSPASCRLYIFLLRQQALGVVREVNVCLLQRLPSNALSIIPPHSPAIQRRPVRSRVFHATPSTFVIRSIQAK